MSVERPEHRLREGVSHDDQRIRALALHRIEERLGIEVGLWKRHRAATSEQIQDRREQAGTVHEWAGGNLHGAGAEAPDVLGVLGHRCGHAAGVRADRAAGAQRRPEIVRAPHHALRRPGRAPRVDQEQVVAGALHTESGPLSFCTQSLQGRRGGRSLASRLDPVDHAGQSRRERLHLLPERLLEEDEPGVRIVQDVVQLLVPVAVVHVHVNQTRLETGRQGDQVLAAIAQIEGEFLAGARASGEQRGRQPVRAPGELAPGDAVIGVDQTGRIRRQHRLDRVENVPEVPAHGSRPPLRPARCPPRPGRPGGVSAGTAGTPRCGSPPPTDSPTPRGRAGRTAPPAAAPGFPPAPIPAPHPCGSGTA